MTLKTYVQVDSVEYFTTSYFTLRAYQEVHEYFIPISATSYRRTTSYTHVHANLASVTQCILRKHAHLGHKLPPQTCSVYIGRPLCVHRSRLSSLTLPEEACRSRVEAREANASAETGCSFYR